MADNMQNEAMERLKQMYSKAQPQKATHNNQKENTEPDVVEVTTTESKVVHKNKGENLLDFFMKDKEKSLILLLIVILMSEKADTSLILALMYLVI